MNPKVPLQDSRLHYSLVIIVTCTQSTTPCSSTILSSVLQILCFRFVSCDIDTMHDIRHSFAISSTITLIICFTGFHEFPFASQDIFNVLTTLPSLIALQVFVQNGGQYVKYLCLYSISFTFKAFTCHSTFTSLFFPLLIKIK